MAAALLQQRVASLRVRSAGLAAELGQPAAAGSIAVLSEIGIDIRAHRAVQLTRQLASQSELILTMTAAQAGHLEALYPSLRGRIFAIRGFDDVDIDDPIGMPVRAFRACRDTLADGVEHWARRLESLHLRAGERAHPGARHVHGGAR
jgi:protein-tyrosine phosphatase